MDLPMSSKYYSMVQLKFFRYACGYFQFDCCLYVFVVAIVSVKQCLTRLTNKINRPGKRKLYEVCFPSAMNK